MLYSFNLLDNFRKVKSGKALELFKEDTIGILDLLGADVMMIIYIEIITLFKSQTESLIWL